MRLFVWVLYCALVSNGLVFVISPHGRDFVAPPPPLPHRVVTNFRLHSEEMLSTQVSEVLPPEGRKTTYLRKDKKKKGKTRENVRGF